MRSPSVPAPLDDDAALTRRRLLVGAGSLTAAVLASAGGVLSTATPAGATAVTGLVTGPGNGVANRLALQAAIDAAAEGETLQFPAGRFEVDVEAAPVWLRLSVNLVGAPGTTPTVFDVVPGDHLTNGFLRVNDGSNPADPGYGGVMSGVFRFSDFTINGPTQAYLTPYSGVAEAERTPGACAIDWSVRGSNGMLAVRRVTITGAFAGGVQRSGLGLTHVVDCDISAYVSAVSIFDDTNTEGGSGAVISGGLHTTGTTVGLTTKYSSIGLYIHACSALLLSDVTYTNFQRYGVYTNGFPDSPPSAWVVQDVTIDGCGGTVQTASVTDSLFVRLRILNRQPGPGGGLKGSATFVDCHFSDSVAFGWGSNLPETLVQFISCWIEPIGEFIAAGNGFGQGTNGTLRFIGCTAALAGSAGLAKTTPQWSGHVEVLDTEIYDCGAGWGLINIEGGTIEIDNSTAYTDQVTPIWGDPGQMTGALDIEPPTTCPSPPA